MGNIVILATTFAYSAAFIGFFMGKILSLSTKKYGQRFRGSIMGFTGGLLISFVCFELLPNAFDSGRFYTTIVGMLCGVLTTAYFEDIISGIAKTNKDYGNIKNAILLSMGIVIHNIPEGLAIGSLFAVSKNEGINLCLIIALHCIPEGLAVSMANYGKNTNLISMSIYLAAMAIPMGLGSFLGAVASEVSDVLMTLCFSIAGGVMLYIACGEIIPESKEIWNGRLTTLGAVLGFIIGIVIIYEI